MKSTALVPLFTTDKITETREFYTKYLDFEIFIDNEMYLGLRLGEGGLELGFMPKSSEHSLGDASGLLYCFAVDDIAAEHAALKAKGAQFSAELEDMPWGDRRLTLEDPNGITVYIAQRIADPVDMG